MTVLLQVWIACIREPGAVAKVTMSQQESMGNKWSAETDWFYFTSLSLSSVITVQKQRKPCPQIWSPAMSSSSPAMGLSCPVMQCSSVEPALLMRACSQVIGCFQMQCHESWLERSDLEKNIYSFELIIAQKQSKYMKPLYFFLS